MLCGTLGRFYDATDLAGHAFHRICQGWIRDKTLDEAATIKMCSSISTFAAQCHNTVKAASKEPRKFLKEALSGDYSGHYQKLIGEVGETSPQYRSLLLLNYDAYR